VQWTPWGQRAAGESVRAYLLEHPEVLPEAMTRLQQKEMAARLAPLKAQVTKPFPGAFLGNPAGKKVLVEFSDYACGYCRQSVAEVEALIAADPELKVVIREYPILSPESELAARMALAAAEQGKFAAFHRALFTLGQLTPASVEEAGRRAGVDLEEAKAFMGSAKVQNELAMNMRLAEALGFTGTPSWVVGNEAFSGAVGRAALAKALGSAPGK
jgi:protein-disulfide isomerase